MSNKKSFKVDDSEAWFEHPSQSLIGTKQNESTTSPAKVTPRRVKPTSSAHSSSSLDDPTTGKAQNPNVDNSSPGISGATSTKPLVSQGKEEYLSRNQFTCWCNEQTNAFQGRWQ